MKGISLEQLAFQEFHSIKRHFDLRHFTEHLLKSIIKLLTVVLEKENKGRNLNTIFSGNAFSEIPKPVYCLINNYFNEMP